MTSYTPRPSPRKGSHFRQNSTRSSSYLLKTTTTTGPASAPTPGGPTDRRETMPARLILT